MLDTVRAAYICFFSGMVMNLIGIILIMIKNARIKSWEEAIGEVVDIKSRERKVKYITYTEYAPVVKFNANNEVVIGDDGIYIIEEAFPFKIGSKVNLRYNPVNNKKFYVIYEGLWKQMYRDGAILLLVGTTFVMIGFMFYFGLVGNIYK